MKPRNARFHYAWIVCAGCALLLFCTSGLSVNAFTIYQPYIMEVNGFTNTQTSSVISFRTFAGLTAMLISGFYYKKLSLRNGMAAAGILAAVGFALFGAAKTYAGYCVGACAVGLGYGLGAMIPIASVIRNWFAKSRNLALGICSAATGLSTIGIPSLITRGIETAGLGRTFFAEAAVMGVLTAVSFLLIRSSPADMRMTALGGTEEQSVKTDAAKGLSAGQTALILPAVFLVGGVMSVAYCHFSVHITSSGYPSSLAALVSSFSGLALIVGKITYGRAGDRFSNYKSNFPFGALLITGCAACCLIPAGKAFVFLSEILFSLGMAFTSVGLTAWAVDLSAPEKCEKNIRLFQILYASGTLVFSPVPGMIADASGGSYTMSYALFTVLGVYILAAVQYCYRQKEKQNVPV